MSGECCPVCGRSCGPPEAVYRHLLRGHRKGALARQLVDETPRPSPTVGQR